jgi:dTMP kinase
MRTGKFVVIEGGVGCGKTTVYNKLKGEFKKWKYYREPGSTPFGERVRKAVQGLYHYPVDKYAAVFGYNAARANLIRTKVIPDLKKGKTVVLNRYWFSTYAYQGAEGVDKKKIVEISSLASDGLMPNLVIHLDQDPKIGLSRKVGKKDADRYDIKKLVFHKKLRKNYLELAKIYEKIWRVVDASQDKKKVYSDVLHQLKKFRIVT